MNNFLLFSFVVIFCLVWFFFGYVLYNDSTVMCFFGLNIKTIYSLFKQNNKKNSLNLHKILL